MYLDERSSVPRAHFHIVQTLRELKPAAQRLAHQPPPRLATYDLARRRRSAATAG